MGSDSDAGRPGGEAGELETQIEDLRRLHETGSACSPSAIRSIPACASRCTPASTTRSSGRWSGTCSRTPSSSPPPAAGWRCGRSERTARLRSRSPIPARASRRSSRPSSSLDPARRANRSCGLQRVRREAGGSEELIAVLAGIAESRGGRPPGPTTGVPTVGRLTPSFLAASHAPEVRASGAARRRGRRGGRPEPAHGGVRALRRGVRAGRHPEHEERAQRIPV
jgi:hypothetical protein